MAPALVDPLPAQHPTGLDTKVFPDGLKTSGQHAPIPSLVRPFSEYPKHISGPTVWKAEDYSTHPERWIHVFSDEEIAELSKAADDYIASGEPLTGMTKDKFPLPKLEPFFTAVRNEVINGKGFILFKGIPVEEWSLQKSATAYLGFGSYFGYFTSQNSRGHVLGHVKDLGDDPTQKHRVRIYRTSEKQPYHTDGSDLVGLLCIAKALEGGESDILSTHHLYNTLQQEHPDVVETLCTPNWYFDRKGEVSQGEDPWYVTAPFLLENRADNPRLWCRMDPNYVESLSRFSTGPDAKIPPLSDRQRHALRVWDETCKRLSLHMILDPGDIQLLANSHILHARTAYKDYPAGAVDEHGRPRVRRHLMRLWLGVPEQEGGWRLPHKDSGEKKRGGIQVDDTPPHCPLDAE